jgi:hypothetical protein
MLLGRDLTAEEKQTELENLAMHIDEMLDDMDEHDESYLAVYKALEALEKQLGSKAYAIRLSRA